MESLGKMVLPLQVKVYSEELVDYIRKPSQIYLLGAIGVLRNLIRDMIFSIDDFKQKVIDDEERDRLILYKREFMDLSQTISLPLHYQGINGYDFDSTEADQFRTNPLRRSQDSKLKVMTLGEMFIFALSVFGKILQQITSFIEDDIQEYYSELLEAIEQIEQLEGKPITKFDFVWNQAKTGQSAFQFYTYMGSLASIIQDADKNTNEKTKIQMLSVAFACRIIAETSGHYLLSKHIQSIDAEKQQKTKSSKGRGLGELYLNKELDGVNVTLNDYLDCFRGESKFIKQQEKQNKVFCYTAMMQYIENYCNVLVDEYDKRKDGNGLRSLDRFLNGKQQSDDLRQVIASTASLVEMLINDPRPESVKYLLSQYRSDIKKLQRKVKVQRYLGLLSLPVFTLGLLALVAFLMYNHEYIDYYRDYVWIDGQPVGICQIKIEDAEEGCYRITTKGKICCILPGHVYQLEHIDHTGKVRNENQTERLDRPAKIEIDLTGCTFKGTPTYATYYDEDGNVLCCVELSRNGELLKYSHPDTNLEMLLPFDMTDVNIYTWKDQSVGNEFTKNSSEMSFKRLIRDDKGREMVVYFRMDDHVYTDGNGIEKIKYTYDELSRISTIDYDYNPYLLMAASSNSIEQYGKTSLLKSDRVIRKEYSYDSDRLSKVTVYRSDNSNTIIEYEYDSFGNCITESITELMNNRKVIHHWSFDEKTGDLLTERWTDGNGTAISNPDGVHSIIYQYENGRLCKIQRFNENGKLMVNEWAEHVREYQEEGDLLKVREYYLNDAGFMLQMNMGYVYWDTEYSVNSIYIKYYNADGTPTQHRMGYYQYRETRNDQQRVREYLDADGRLIDTAYGYSRGIDQYSGSLLMSSVMYDKNGNLVNVNGVCGSEKKYNAKRQVEEIKYSSATGIFQDGYNRVVYQYDTQNGRLLMHAYYLDDACVVSNKDGYAMVIYKYDDEGNGKTWMYYDENGNPMIREECGYSSITEIEDEKGNVLSEYYYDEQGKPIYVEGIGYGIEFDKDSNSVLFMLITGESSPTDVMYKRVTYSDINLKVKEEWLNEQYELTKDPQTGISTMQYEYFSADYGEFKLGAPYAATVLCCDTYGNLTSNAEWGTPGCIVCYDEHDRITNVRYFAENNVIGSELLGYAGYDIYYDSEGNLIRKVYVDTNDKPIDRQDEGYAIEEFIYNKRGNQVSQRFFNSSREPAMNSNKGYATVEWAYNARNEVIEERMFDANSNLIIRNDIAVIGESYVKDAAMQYTVIRNVIKSSNLSGRPEKVIDLSEEQNIQLAGAFPQGLFSMVSGKERGFDWTYYYDFDGRTEDLDILSLLLNSASVQESYKPNTKYMLSTPLPTGEYIGFCFDEEMRLTEEWFSDEEGQLVTSSGYALCERYYDVEGNRIVQIYYNEDFKIVCPNREGYAACLTTYDEQNRIVDRCYYDEMGKPTVNPQTGYAICSIEYDEKGHVHSIMYLQDENAFFDGNEIQWSFSDSFTLKNNTVKGYAQVDYEYDDAGRRISESYYGEDGKLVNTFLDYATMIIDYPEELSGDQAIVGMTVETKDVIYRNAIGEIESIRFVRSNDGEVELVLGDMPMLDEIDEKEDNYDLVAGMGLQGVQISYNEGQPYDLHELSKAVKGKFWFDRSPNPSCCYLISQAEGIDGHTYERVFFTTDNAGKKYFLVAEYDGSMNLTSLTCFDQQWKQSYLPSIGCSVFCQLFDDSNRVVGQYYLNEKNEYVKNVLTGDVARVYLYTNDNERMDYSIDEHGKGILLEEKEGSSSLTSIVAGIAEKRMVRSFDIQTE